MRNKILIIDDEVTLCRLLRIALEARSFEVETAYDGPTGLKVAYKFQPDLIILDIMLPDTDGFQICKRLRELLDVPVVMLTARTKEEDIIHGFGCGADDYVKKPFGVEELVARIQAILNRTYSHPAPNHVYDDGILSIDINAKLVQKRGKQIHLSSTELRLLTSLVARQGKIVPHNVLLTEVWGRGYEDAKSSLSLYIRYLRGKLEDTPKKPEYIRTEWGTGYWFAPRNSH